MLSQAIGGLLGGGQQAGGAAGIGQLLGGLQQIIGGTPGTGQQLPLGGGNTSMGSSDPIMGLLQPVVNQLAAKAGISPQIATVIASIAVHYLLQSLSKHTGRQPAESRQCDADAGLRRPDRSADLAEQRHRERCYAGNGHGSASSGQEPQYHVRRPRRSCEPVQGKAAAKGKRRK